MPIKTTEDSGTLKTGHLSLPETHTCSECELDKEHLLCDECLEEMLGKRYDDGFRDGQSNSVSD